MTYDTQRVGFVDGALLAHLAHHGQVHKNASDLAASIVGFKIELRLLLGARETVMDETRLRVVLESRVNSEDFVSEMFERLGLRAFT